MSGDSNNDTGAGRADPDFAQAMKDIARGERAAAAMESHLDTLERKIEELLAKADEEERQLNSHSKDTEKFPARDESKDAT